jgi:hypothetical protein
MISTVNKWHERGKAKKTCFSFEGASYLVVVNGFGEPVKASQVMRIGTTCVKIKLYW